MRARKPIKLALAVLIAAATGPGVAAAAPPADFYGVWATGTLNQPDGPRGAAMDAQARGGARHLRQFFEWGQIEPTPGQYRFDEIDSFVADAARRGLRILPVLSGSTDWNTLRPPWDAANGTYPPGDPKGFGDFAHAVAGRYGPDGTFWHENPGLPYVPIVSFQVWNEPSIPYFWPVGPDARAYTALLEAASRGIRRAAPGVEVVAAGIPNSTLGSPMIAFVRQMYEAGAADWFDVLAIHPYSPDVGNVVAALTSVRQEMDSHGDASPIWASEFGWATGGDATSLTVSEAEQAVLVDRSLRLLAGARVKLNLRGATYYAWQDVPPTPGRDIWTAHVGLLRVDGSPKPAALAFERVAAPVPPAPLPAPAGQALGTAQGDAGAVGSPGPPGSPGANGGSGATGSTRGGVLRLTLVNPRVVRIRAGGRIRLRLGCWSPHGGACAGTIRLTQRRGGKRLATHPFRSASGQTARVNMRLTSTARRLLARNGRVRVRAVARVRDGAASRTTATIAFVLLARR